MIHKTARYLLFFSYLAVFNEEGDMNVKRKNEKINILWKKGMNGQLKAISYNL